LNRIFLDKGFSLIEYRKFGYFFYHLYHRFIFKRAIGHSKNIKKNNFFVRFACKLLYYIFFLDMFLRIGKSTGVIAVYKK
jgi:hypothetical protein